MSSLVFVYFFNRHVYKFDRNLSDLEFLKRR